MIKKYENEKHRAQADDFLKQLGEFALDFERICESMRYTIIFMLQSQGLQNQRMAYVVIGDKASAELQLLLGALFMEMPNKDEEDKKCIKNLLRRIKEITEKRNLLLHNSWDFGNKAGWGKELLAVATRFRTTQNKGSEIQPHGVSASYVKELR